MSNLNNTTASGPSRRDILRIGLAGAVFAGTGSLLSACGGNARGRTSATKAAGPPKKGGTLTVGMISEGQSEAIDPWTFLGTTGYLRSPQLYDTLFDYEDDLTVKPALAESYTVSPDFRTWTFRLRSGVTFHDGSTLTADDLVYNLHGWLNPNSWPGSNGAAEIDPKQITKIDARTVRVGLTAPNARLHHLLAFLAFGIKSRNEKKGGTPIGTGPFKFVSFTPGSRSEFVRFDNHWRPEPVYLDRLIVDSSFTDENSRTNALKSGNVDLIPLVSFSLAKTIPPSTASLLRAKSGAFDNFYMAVDAPPFNDVNVRQALRLLVDRKAMVDVAYAGFGDVSNDVPGKYTPYYDTSLVRDRDVEQAKYLLRKAGKENLTVTLQTAAISDPSTLSATQFKAQARDAGVTVNFKQIDPSTYWSDYGKWTFAQTLYYPVPSMETVWTASFISTGTVNETHWHNSPNFARTRSLVYEAKATSDDSKLTEIWQELQKQQFDSGGYINFGTYDYIDGVANHVQGLTPSKYLFASGCNLRRAWLAA